jgi:hypothetical protein
VAFGDGSTENLKWPGVVGRLVSLPPTKDSTHKTPAPHPQSLQNHSAVIQHGNNEGHPPGDTSRTGASGFSSRQPSPLPPSGSLAGGEGSEVAAVTQHGNNEGHPQGDTSRTGASAFSSRQPSPLPPSGSPAGGEGSEVAAVTQHGNHRDRPSIPENPLASQAQTTPSDLPS